jgi:hypothetical protein
MAAANCKAKGCGRKTNAKDVEESKSKWQIWQKAKAIMA